MAGEQNHLPYGMVLLPSKINIPAPTAQVLARQRLNDTFQQSLFCPLTTVVASAGFGKTTAILSWANTTGAVPVAWFLLDTEDGALDRFWRYFIAAIRNADEEACLSFSEVQMNSSFEAMQPVIDSLIWQLSEYGDDFICVLEDFHTVQGVEGINESLRYFIKHLPPNVHVVISSRQPVHFPTQKMRVEGLLVEITETDLRFTRSEIVDFFKLNQIALSRSDLDELCEATKGWPTGNKLVMLYCEGSSAPVQEALRRAKSSISSYLLEELFETLTEVQQDFLVATSAVSTFSPSLAERVTGLSKARVMEIIDFLIVSDLFIERTEGPDNEEWYRYQMLLAEMLHNRLAHTESTRVVEIRKTARDWFEEHGFFDYVVEISSAIGDFTKIKEVILRNWMFLYMTDAQSTLLRWADMVPEDEIQKSPMLCAVLAMPVALAGDSEKGNVYIRTAIENLHDNEDFLFALCMVQKAYLYAFQNDYENARVCSQKALQFLPEKEYYLRGMMLQVLASSYSETDPLYAKAGFLKAIEVQQPLGNKNLLCSAYCNTAQICVHLGHVEEAEYYVDLAISLYSEQERRFMPMLALAYVARMGCSYQRGNYQEVLDIYCLYEACATNTRIVGTVAEAKAILAKALYALGDASGKGEFFQALSVSVIGSLAVFPSLTMAKDYHDAFRTKAAEFAEGDTAITAARIFAYSLGFHLGLDTLCEEVCKFADGIDREERLSSVYGNILAALYCEKAAQHTTSLSYMAQALTYAKEYNLSAPLRENMGYLRSLLTVLSTHDAWRSTDEALFAQQLLGQQEEGLFKLTDREIDVMRFIAEGFTIADAAVELYVSRDTVKKHLANIYVKLGVHSKMQAVVLLQQKGII